MSNKWAEEDKELVKLWSELGWTAKEIGEELNRSEKSVSHCRTKLGIRVRRQYSDKELLDILRNSENTGSVHFMYTKELPSVDTYQRHFGSWNKALEAAGIPLNTSSMQPNKPTTFYLIEFDGFYKIGITQQISLQKRFSKSKYPQYKVLFKHTGDFEFVQDTEKYLLAYLEDYKYQPPNFGGFTECFKMSKNDTEHFLEKLYNIFLTAQKPNKKDI